MRAISSMLHAFKGCSMHATCNLQHENIMQALTVCKNLLVRVPVQALQKGELVADLSQARRVQEQAAAVRCHDLCEGVRVRW